MKILARFKDFPILHLYLLLIPLSTFSQTIFFSRSILRYAPFMLVAGLIVFMFIIQIKLNSIKVGSFRRFLDTPTIFLGTFIIWGSFVSLFSNNFKNSLNYIIGSVVIFIVGYLVIRYRANYDNLIRILVTYIFVGVFFAVISVWQVTFNIIFGSGFDMKLFDVYFGERLLLENLPVLKSITRHEGILGILLFYAISAGFVVLFLERRRISSYLWYVTSFLSLVLFLTFSRASQLSTIAFLAFSSLGFISRKFFKPAIFLGFFIFVFLGIFVSDKVIIRLDNSSARPFISNTQEEVLTEEVGKTDSDVVEDSSDTNQSQSPSSAKKGLSGRLELWKASLDFLNERPIFGSGFGNSSESIEPYIGDEFKRFKGLTPHSTIVRTAVETGVLGVTLYIGFIVAVYTKIVREVMRNKKLRPTLLLLGVLISSALVYQVFVTTFVLGVGFLSFYFLIIISSTLALIDRANENSPRK